MSRAYDTNGNMITGINPRLPRNLPQPRNNRQYVRTERKIGRNDPCPCGSGRKYKKCHIGK